MKLEVKWLFLTFCPQNLIKVSFQNRNYLIMCDTNMSSLCVKVWAQLDLKATDDTLRKTFSPEELGLFLQKLRPEMLCALQERSSSTTFLLGWLSRSSGGTSGSGQVYWSDCCLLVSLFSISRTTWSGTCLDTPTDRRSSLPRGISLYLGRATILLSR